MSSVLRSAFEPVIAYAVFRRTCIRHHSVDSADTVARPLSGISASSLGNGHMADAAFATGKVVSFRRLGSFFSALGPLVGQMKHGDAADV